MLNMCLTYSTEYYQRITLESWFRTNCLKSLSTSSRTLQMCTQQETVTPCLLFILQPTYLHNLSPHTFSQPITSRSPGFLNFELINTTTWLWRWLPHRLSKHLSLTTVLLRTPITQMILFNQGMFISNYLWVLPDY